MRNSQDSWHVLRLTAQALAGSAMFAFAGCSTLPSLQYMNAAAPAAPTKDQLAISDLVQHINCQLQDSISRGLSSDDAKMRRNYARLIQDRFIAVIDLNVKVTDNQSATPSLSFLNPMSGGESYTFGAGGQLSGQQDRSFDFSYVADLTQLAKSANVQQVAGAPPDYPDSVKTNQAPDATALQIVQTKDTMCDGNTTAAPAGESWLDKHLDKTGISGDLGLDETIRNGLDVMDIAAPYNIYGDKGSALEHISINIGNDVDNITVAASKVAKAPTIANTQTLSSHTASLYEKLLNRPFATLQPDLLQKLQDTQQTLNGVSENKLSNSAKQNLSAAKSDLAAATGQGGEKAAAASSGSSNTKFATSVNFTIVTNINGGPTWSLKYFKGPSGNNGLLSFSRTNLDSLTASFVPTCRGGSADTNPEDYWHTIPVCTAADVEKSVQSASANNQTLRLENAFDRLPAGLLESR